MSKEQTIGCKIILTKPFRGIAYGIQIGDGNSYTTAQRQIGEDLDLVFTIALPFKDGKDGKSVWYGPIVQGPPDKRFLYLDIGSYAGQSQSLINGRLKVPLPGLTDQSAEMMKNGYTFSTTIAATREKDGKPNFGTVKPFDGWNIIESTTNPQGA